MVGLAGVCQGWGGHGHLHLGEHVVEPPHPAHAVVLLLHGKVEGDSQEHLLGGLHGDVLAGADDVPLQQQVKGGEGQEVVPLALDEGLRLHNLRLGVGVEDVVAVKPLLHQILHLVVESMDAQLGHVLTQLLLEGMVQKAPGDELPLGGLRAHQLRGCPHQG